MFGSVDANSLGCFLSRHIIPKLIQNERRKGFEASPDEREAHFERANQLADALGYYHLYRGLHPGR